MKEEISALFDDELDHAEAVRAVDRVLADADTGEKWLLYHSIGDAMRGETLPDRPVIARLHERLGAEPTVLCPGAMRRRQPDVPVKWAAAAAVAGVAVVVVAALGMQVQHGGPDLARVDSVGGHRIEPLRPLAGSTGEEYFLAHQAVSPSGALNGFPHYARTVAAVRPEGTAGR